MKNFVIVAGAAVIVAMVNGFAAIPASVIAASPDPQGEAARVDQLFA